MGLEHLRFHIPPVLRGQAEKQSLGPGLAGLRGGLVKLPQGFCVSSGPSETSGPEDRLRFRTGGSSSFRSGQAGLPADARTAAFSRACSGVRGRRVFSPAAGAMKSQAQGSCSGSSFCGTRRQAVSPEISRVLQANLPFSSASTRRLPRPVSRVTAPSAPVSRAAIRARPAIFST